MVVLVTATASLRLLERSKDRAELFGRSFWRQHHLALIGSDLLLLRRNSFRDFVVGFRSNVLLLIVLVIDHQTTVLHLVQNEATMVFGWCWGRRCVTSKHACIDKSATARQEPIMHHDNIDRLLLDTASVAAFISFNATLLLQLLCFFF